MYRQMDSFSSSGSSDETSNSFFIGGVISFSVFVCLCLIVACWASRSSQSVDGGWNRPQRFEWVPV